MGLNHCFSIFCGWHSCQPVANQQRIRKKCGVADLQRGELRQTCPNLFHRLITRPVKQSAGTRESPAKIGGTSRQRFRPWGWICGLLLLSARNLLLGCLGGRPWTPQFGIDRRGALGYQEPPSQHGPVSHARSSASEEG